jgi:hypothetical protein
VGIILAKGFGLANFGIPIVAGTYSGVFTDTTGAVTGHWTLTVTIP